MTSLSRHNCLSYSLSPLQGRGVWYFGKKGEFEVPVRGNLSANNGEALLAAALGDQGVIYQPSFIVDDALVNGALVAIDLDQPPLDLGGLHVLFPADRSQPVKVRAMIDYLLECFSDSNQSFKSS